jgi:hypothetical protein
LEGLFSLQSDYFLFLFHIQVVLPQLKTYL